MAALKLRMLRVNAGLSQAALARKAGVSPPTIVSLERGNLPHPSTAFAVARVFGLKSSDLWPELVEGRGEQQPA